MTIAAPSPFPFRHDWATPFAIRREWSTDILTALDGSETRVQRRPSPAISVTMRVQFVSEMGMGRVLATWRGATTPLRYFAPLWCDASDLTTAITAGDETIFCDLADRPFLQQAPSHVMVIRDEAHAEVLDVSRYTTGQLTVSAAANSYAKPGTRVVPVRAMWLKMPVAVTWENAQIANATLEFFDQIEQAGYEIDDTGAAPTPQSMEIYLHSNGHTGSQPINHATFFVEAVPFDGAGVPIVSAAVVWEVANLEDSGDITIIPSLDTRLAKVIAATPSYTITATSGDATQTVTS